MKIMLFFIWMGLQYNNCSKNTKRNCTLKPFGGVIDIIILSPYILMIKNLQDRENGIEK